MSEASTKLIDILLAQGGGCPVCHGQGALMSRTWNIPCDRCKGTGITAELSAALDECGMHLASAATVGTGEAA